MAKNGRRLMVLGTRGIPANHGGFETFAERLALHLVDRGWEVVVYCQVDLKQGRKVSLGNWNGVDLVKIPVGSNGAWGTIWFDILATLHSLKYRGLYLVLGYNTAFLSIIYRLLGRYNLINMDGVEWKRKKWGKAAKAWFYINEQCAKLFGNHLIADHPEIKRHIGSGEISNKVTMIPYGADSKGQINEEYLKDYGLLPFGYSLLIARAEPENSILEIVRAFNKACKGGHKLVILGDYCPELNHYHKEVVRSAGPDIAFLGAIYDRDRVFTLRKYCQIYFHGHTVGGTNPTLVEAMGAGCAIIAHNNVYNKWVAGEGAQYFSGEHECVKVISGLLADDKELLKLRKLSFERYEQNFTWPKVLEQYELLLEQQV